MTCDSTSARPVCCGHGPSRGGRTSVPFLQALNHTCTLACIHTIQDVQFVAAMGPPGGGRTSITPRYVRHFHVLAITDSSDATLKHIFTTVQVCMCV